MYMHTGDEHAGWHRPRAPRPPPGPQQKITSGLGDAFQRIIDQLQQYFMDERHNPEIRILCGILVKNRNISNKGLVAKRRFYSEETQTRGGLGDQ
jgi:hypothetical protein